MGKDVSNPFIAGHSFLRIHAFVYAVLYTCFKPLHSGAFLLTGGDIPSFDGVSVSNPFIAGHSFLPVICAVPVFGMRVSNPFIAGHSFLPPLAEKCWFGP